MGKIKLDGNVNFNCFHGTFFDKCDNIIKSGFIIPKPQKTNDHWLGHGIYFYDSYFLANWWAKRKAISYRKKYQEKHIPAVIYCNIFVPQEQVLNLDDRIHLQRFARYCNSKTKELGLTEHEFHVKKEGDVPSADQIRCFLLDLYKLDNKIGIVIYTFNKQITSYSKSVFKFGNHINLGLEYKEAQYCVSSNDYIRDRYVYNAREEYV